jgi:TM2 domain-containing membrane protein YozV
VLLVRALCILTRRGKGSLSMGFRIKNCGSRKWAIFLSISSCAKLLIADCMKSSSSVGNAGIVLIEMCLGAAFLVFLGKGWWRVAGILEWIVSFLGAFWLYTFIGYVAYVKFVAPRTLENTNTRLQDSERRDRNQRA